MLPGLKSMLNIHPLFVHFPIAFWFGALLFELLAIWRSNNEFHSTAVRLLNIGTICAYAAAFVNRRDVRMGINRFSARCLTTGTATPSPVRWYASL